MKKIIFILAISPFMLMAQENKISIDFSKSSFIPKSGNQNAIKFVEHGETVTFTIDSVNQLIYDVSINGVVVNYTTEIPPDLKKLAGLDQAAQTEGAEKEVEKLIRTVPKSKKSTADSVYNVYCEKYRKVIDIIHHLEETKRIYKEVELISLTNTDTEKTPKFITDSCKAIMADFLDRKSIFEYNAELKYQLEEAAGRELEIFNQIPKEKNLSQKIDDLNKILTDKNYISNLKENEISQYDKIRYSQINDLHLKVTELLKKVNEYDYDDLAIKLMKLYDRVIDRNNYYFSSAPIQAKGDEVKFTYKVTLKKDLSLHPQPLNKGIPETTYTLWTKGGLSLKFATGIGLNSLSLLNQQYSLIPQDSLKDENTGKMTARTKISKDKTTDWFIPNGVAYAHFLSRRKENLYIGGSIGANIDFKDINSSGINLGFTGAFGSKQILAITAGIAFANVDVLKGKYKNNEIYNTADIDATALTKNSFRCGLFLGLSLNLKGND